MARRSLAATRRTVRPATKAPASPTALPGGNPASDLDRLVHEPVRLGIVSALAVNDTLSFRDLRDFLETTDGNLSVHARKLEDAAYISCTKHFEGRTPKTEFKITAGGRRALEKYLEHMEALIVATRQ